MAHGSQPQLREAMLDLKHGDPQAVRRLYQLTSGKLYGKLLGLLKTPELARQALQDTYLNLWRDREAIPPAQNDYMHLIAAVAHRSAIAIRFRSKMSGTCFEELDGGVATGGGSRSGSIALQSLDDADRAMLTAAYLEFESAEVIAERLGLTPEQVRGRLAQLASRGGADHE